MQRADLEHIIRAAAVVAQDDEFVIIGSQAILGQFPDAPAPLLLSPEADLYPRHHPDRATEIDGALGDGSPFHEAYGYYAHGVGPETAKPPAGWQGRLVPVHVAALAGSGRSATGWCLEVHDLVLAKCAAGRQRDWDFAADAIRHGVVDAQQLLRRLPTLPLPHSQRAHLKRVLTGIIAQAQGGRG